MRADVLFREWRISFAVLFISVTGICGSLLALWLTGVPLNVSSYTGIIMIVGIIAENAIFTVHQYNMNRRAGGDTAESVNYAIALRIRPKLMTAISSILASCPSHWDWEAGTDAAAAGGSSHRRILCRTTTAVGRVAQFDDGHL